MIAVPVVYLGLVCRYLWKFGDSTARIQYHPDCKVFRNNINSGPGLLAFQLTVPGPVPEGELPLGAVVDGPPGVVFVGVTEGIVVVLRVVGDGDEAAPGWH